MKRAAKKYLSLSSPQGGLLRGLIALTQKMSGKPTGNPDSLPRDFVHRQKEPDQLPGLGVGQSAFENFGPVTLKRKACIKVEEIEIGIFHLTQYTAMERRSQGT